MPELVQVGNETNGEIASSLAKAKEPIHWDRNALLFNAGIKAVRDAGRETGTKPRLMLHIAQPENAEPWFAAATKAGVTDYDIIGLSYYSKWSKRSMAQLGETINRLRHTYAADVLVVETAYPFTTENADSSPNLLGEDSLIAGYPATPAGQKKYLVDLTQLVLSQRRHGRLLLGAGLGLDQDLRHPLGQGLQLGERGGVRLQGRCAGQRRGLAEARLRPAGRGDVQGQGDGRAAFIDGDFLGGVGPKADDPRRRRLRLPHAPGAGDLGDRGHGRTAAAVADAPAVTATVGQAGQRGDGRGVNELRRSFPAPLLIRRPLMSGLRILPSPRTSYL
jgi:arabinogalactan endo-1,4-beta-galactosidase